MYVMWCTYLLCLWVKLLPKGDRGVTKESSCF